MQASKGSLPEISLADAFKKRAEIQNFRQRLKFKPTKKPLKKNLFDHISSNSANAYRAIKDGNFNWNTVDKNGNTPLHTAVISKQYNLAFLLLKRGADVNYKNKYGKTPLHFAVILGELELTMLLLDFAADIEAEDNIRQKPLHYAAKLNRDDIAKLLLSKGAFKNPIDKKGNTPLHLASREKNTALVLTLIATGADCLIKNKCGKTAFDLSINFGINNILRNHEQRKKTYAVSYNILALSVTTLLIGSAIYTYIYSDKIFRKQTYTHVIKLLNFFEKTLFQRL